MTATLGTGDPIRLDPARVGRTRMATLRKVGLSERKAEYIRDLARHFVSGALDPAQWPELADEELIERLVGVKGIGRWTAEMFLMFHELRPDILPLADIGLQKAAALHYHDGVRLPSGELREFAAMWSPFRSVATWYLWRSLDPIPVDYWSAVVRGPRPPQHAIHQMQRAVGARGEFRIVRDDHQRRADHGVQFQHEIEHLSRGAPVEIAGGLVGQHALRLRHQRPCQRHALSFPAREFAGPVQQPMAEADPFEHRGRRGVRFTRRDAADEQGHRRVLDGVELGEQVVELVDESERAVAHPAALGLGQRREPNAVDAHVAGRGYVETAEQMQ